MHIRYITKNEIDKAKWDNCISSSNNGLIYAYSWYLDIAAERWDALVSGDYEFVMPLIRKTKYGIKYLYLPPFTQQTGIFSKQNINKDTIEAFLNHIPKKFWFRDINLNYSNSVIIYKTISKNNFTLYLKSSYKDLYKNFSKNTKRNINKSYEFDLQIKKDVSVIDAIKVKRNNNINNLSEDKLRILYTLINSIKDKLNVKIFGAMNSHNDVIATAVFSFSNKRAYIPLLSSFPEGKEKRAMFFIINEFIKEHAEKNLILDFEGSNIEGIARFFKGWGAKNESYYNFKQYRLPLLFWIFKK